MPGPLLVQLWSLILPESNHADDLEQLSEAEQLRAATLHRAQDRSAFIASRAALRRCLSGPLGQPPDAVRIESRRGAKPSFPDLPAGTVVSLSHGPGRLLIAICEGACVGVDLQKIEACDLDLAATVCGANEYAKLTSLAPENRARAFARLWTRKEAITKAQGVGIASDLTVIEVSLDARPRLLRYDRQDAANWYLDSLLIGTGWEAALAVESRARPVVLRRHTSV